MAGLTVVEGIIVANDLMKNHVNTSEKLKICENAPDKYKQLILAEKQGKDINWIEAAQQMEDSIKVAQDSLRMDSIARTNYAKGMQQVRDSINALQLKDTIKTVSKTIK